MTTFSEFLQSEMDERGWSQADLARASGLSDKNVSEYVKKSVVPRDPEKLKGIATGLGLPVNVVRAAAKAGSDENVFRLSPERKADVRTLTATQSEAVYEIIRLLADGNRKAVTHNDSETPITHLHNHRRPGHDPAHDQGEVAALEGSDLESPGEDHQDSP